MNRRRLQLLLIVAAFALPALIAVLLQTRWFHWDPSATRNRGELIVPVIALAGDARAASVFADGRRWSVLVRLPERCDAGCERRIALIGNLREAQGKEMERVHLVAWPSPGATVPAVFTAWQPPTALGDSLALNEGAVILVDPAGNAMMRYRSDTDPTDVRKDLAHLLRWSTLGK